MSNNERIKPAGVAACPMKDGEIPTETTQGSRIDATKKSHKHYLAELHALQVEFVKLHQHIDRRLAR